MPRSPRPLFIPIAMAAYAAAGCAAPGPDLELFYTHTETLRQVQGNVFAHDARDTRILAATVDGVDALDPFHSSTFCLLGSCTGPSFTAELTDADGPIAIEAAVEHRGERVDFALELARLSDAALWQVDDGASSASLLVLHADPIGLTRTSTFATLDDPARDGGELPKLEATARGDDVVEVALPSEAPEGGLIDVETFDETSVECGERSCALSVDRRSEVPFVRP
jgi:hypothetical protein